MKTLRLLALASLLSITGILFAQDTTPGGSNTNTPVADQENRDLKPRDTLRFNVLEDPAGRGIFPQIQITDLGDAQFPISTGSGEYISVKAAGRRLAEVRKELKQKLDADYYQNSTVSLDLLSVAGSDQRGGGSVNAGKVIIYGAVNATIPIREEQKLTLSEIFAQLSSQTEFAKLTRVEVMRVDPANKQNTTIIKNVKKLLDGDLADDMELKDGDRIKVAEKFVRF